MLIVLFAALLHASWNYIVKRVPDKHLSMTAVVIGHTPFAAAALIYAPMPDISAFPYLVSGALLHTGYQIFLMNSYRFGDLSQVYPLARGVSPLIVAGVCVLFLGVKLTWMEMGAVLIIAAGIMSLALVRRSDGLRNIRAATLAVGTGVFIASYSLVDGLGAKQAGTALGFYGWLSVINAVIFAAFIRGIRPGLLTLVICRNRHLSLLGGGASFTAYAMVTWAFTMAPIALVTALRETSIIFALFFGVFFLKERLDLTKLFATMCTILGAVMLRAGK